MSAILAQWLFSPDVGLTVNPQAIPKSLNAMDLDKSFQSGYLLGELLVKLNLMNASDLKDKFSNAKSMEAHIENYTVSERILRENLGIKLSSNFAFDLITGKPGCAARLLYQIKVGLQSKSKPTLAPKYREHEHASPALATLESQKNTKKSRNSKSKDVLPRLPQVPSARRTPETPDYYDRPDASMHGRESAFSSYPGTPTSKYIYLPRL
jgi:hypothetical protein